LLLQLLNAYGSIIADEADSMPRVYCARAEPALLQTHVCLKSRPLELVLTRP